METQDKLGLRNTIVSYSEISNLVDEGRAVDIALTLARLLVFTVTSSQTNWLCDMYWADSFWHLVNRIWLMYLLLDVFPLNGSQASKRSKTLLSHLMKSKGVTSGLHVSTPTKSSQERFLIPNQIAFLALNLQMQWSGVVWICQLFWKCAFEKMIS